MIRKPILFKIVYNESSHGILELFECNYSVTVGICLLEQILPKSAIQLAAAVAVEMFVEVFDSDHIVLVGIENTERSLKVTLIGQNSSINASRNELLEVDDAVSIEITSNKNLVPVNIFTGSHLLEFRFGKSSRSIRVQSDKLSLEQLELFLGSSDV